MQRNNKLAILMVLTVVVVFVWMPKGKKAKDVSSTTSSVTLKQARPVTGAVLRKRTEFVDWGRNPFSLPQTKKGVNGIPNLAPSCIIWSDGKGLALINESIVRVGDKITDKTVKQIEHNRVILTDGTKDYVLDMQE
jgi:hypothetical protein